MNEWFKVLIADDEYWTREKLCKMIDWKKYHLELLEPAEDGEEVLKRMEEAEPDILITDINMPFLNGIDLLKAIQERYHHVVTFVVSGYDDFEFVRESFMAGSINYLVKPISKIDLVNAIVKALEIISDRNSKAEAEEQQKLELKKAASLIQDREFSQLLERKEMPFTPNITMNSNMDFVGASLMLIKIHNLTRLCKSVQYDMNLLSFRIKTKIKEIAGEENLMVFNHVYRSNEFIVVSESESKILIRIARRILKEIGIVAESPVSVILSEHSYSMESLHQAYIQTVALLMMRPFTREHWMMWSKDGKKEQEEYKVKNRITEVQTKELQTLLKSGNKRGAKNLVFEKIGIRHCQEQGWEYLEVKQTVKRILNFLVEYAAGTANLTSQELLDLEYMVELADKAIELLDAEYLCELIDDNIENMIVVSQEEAPDTMREAVHQAVEYIDQHYFEPLTLSGLAKKFHMEHSYFSRMFKKETNETLMMYISKTRIDKAKRYMEQKDSNLTEIAFMVGYDDYTYFNKVFRKITGISPRDYKKSMKSGTDR